MSTENMSPAEHNGHGLSFLETYLREHPESMLFARLADYYLESHRVDEAIHVCEEGIKKHPYYATGHFVLGKSYLAHKMYEQAEKEFKRVLLFDPKFLAAHKMYGDLMKEIGWENTCEMSYKKILQIDPLDEMARTVVETAEAEAEANESGDLRIAKPEEPRLGEGVSSFPEMESPPAVRPVPEPDPAQADPGASKGPVGPIEVSAEEERLLFEEGERLPKKTPDEVDASHTTPEKPLDDQKAEEFSYILDDIFKDEVVEHDTQSSKVSGDRSTPAQAEPEAILAELDLAVREKEESRAKSRQPVTVTKSESADQPRVASPKDEPSVIAYDAKSKKGLNKVAGGSNKGNKMVTPTLGEIYSAQGQYAKAIDVFETLIKKNPDNEFYVKKLAALKIKLDESKD